MTVNSYEQGRAARLSPRGVTPGLMTPSARPREKLVSRTARLVGLLLLGLSACSAQRAAPTTPPAASGGPTSTPFVYPGIKEPPTVPAAEANLTDDEEVIGVVIKGKPRAYRLAPFAGMLHHVVNDVVNKAAVTVTYCDRTDCIRTFTADGDRPLPVMLGGYNGGLLLRVGDDFFLQDTG